MSHPYEQFEGTSLWSTLEKALVTLEANHDLQLTTAPAYVIGSLAQALAHAGLVHPKALHGGTA